MLQISKLGNVMDIQTPEKYDHSRLPTRKQLLDYIESLNLSSNEKDRVRIKEQVYSIDEDGEISIKEHVLKLPTVTDFIHQLEKVTEGNIHAVNSL